MRRRNHLVFETATTNRLPLVVFMGGGYADPIEPTLDAFEDLFRDAARWATDPRLTWAIDRNNMCHVARMVVLSMHLKDDNIPAHSEVMNQRISVCLVAIFLFSMVLPFAEHEENGTTHTTVLEEIDTPRFTSSSMNSPMMLSGSIYSNQTLALGSYGSCAILDDRNVWCWGSMYNSVMDLSWNSTSYAESPYKLDKMELPNGTTAVSIDTGGQGDVCVILNNSNLSCWGSKLLGSQR